MQCPKKHLKTIVYAKFGGQTKCIMGNLKIENYNRQNGVETETQVFCQSQSANSFDDGALF